MSLTKKFLKSKPLCKVTFKVSSDETKNAKEAAVVGEFNSWDPAAGEMSKLKNGSFTTTLDLETGRTYQFRYVLDGTVWVNDEAADDYAASGVGQEQNSVLQL